MYASNDRIRAVICAAAAILIPLSAFGSQPEDELQQRATAYWQARVERSPAVMEYYHPDSREGVLDSGNISFTEFSVEGVEVENTGDTALVRIRVTTHFALPPSFPALSEEHYQPLLNERWDRIDGIWYKRAVENGLHRLMPQHVAQPTSIDGSDVTDVTKEINDSHSEGSEPNS